MQCVHLCFVFIITFWSQNNVIETLIWDHFKWKTEKSKQIFCWFLLTTAECCSVILLFFLFCILQLKAITISFSLEIASDFPFSFTLQQTNNANSSTYFHNYFSTISGHIKSYFVVGVAVVVDTQPDICIISDTNEILYLFQLNVFTFCICFGIVIENELIISVCWSMRIVDKSIFN